MSDDIPIPENSDAQLWSIRGVNGLMPGDVARISSYIHTTAASVLSLDPATDLIRLPHSEIFALAVRAKQAGVEVDVVASLLVLATGRGSTLAAAALAQFVGKRLAESEIFGGDSSDRRKLHRILREVDELLRRRPLLDKFDDLRKEFDAVGEKIRHGKVWAEFKRAGVCGAKHRVLAPNLKSLNHIEGGGDEFKLLSGPVPLWQSPVSTTVLAQVLAAEFPHCADIADDVAQFVAGGSAASARPLLLVGPAGIGKDSLLRRAAEIVKRPFAEYDLAGGSDTRILKGTSKGWSTAAPGHPATICARHRCANPLLLYSELDRAGGSRRNGQMHEALLGLCEPSTRRMWFDDGLGTELDLTDVAIAFSANGLDDTPSPLLSRLRILRLERPKAEHVLQILEQARRRLADELQVPLDMLPEPVPEAIARLEAVAKKGRFHLRLADRIVRALGGPESRTPLN